MRRIVGVLVSVVAILGMLAPLSFAQPPAAAPPAPKVTINGLVDFATSVYKNAIGGDITDGGLDRGWYSRERGVFTITGEIGRVKGVWAMEFDIVNGAAGNNDNTGIRSNFSTNAGAAAGGASTANFDLGTDVNDVMELKWLYVEAPVTGAGSLLPFIPVPTIGRFGGQPLSGHEYKPGIFAYGDFGGVNLATTWAPNVRSTLTFIQIDEALRDNTLAGQAQTEDIAFVASVEVDVFKGLSVKPGYQYARFDGGSNTGIANAAHGGFSPNSAATPTAQHSMATTRHTFGAEARWTAGPWSLSPSYFYQTGTQEVRPGTSNGRTEVDINSWVFDVVAGFRQGPLTIEGRFSWTPGMEATDCVQTIAGVCAGGDDIEYYTALSADPAWWSGWGEIETSSIDYIAAFNPTGGTRLGNGPSYDKYGRIQAGFAIDYAVTPALALHLFSIWQWTAEKVDVHGTVSTTGITPVSRGDESYLGNEWAAGLTYRFAPNIQFDLVGAILFAGDARNTGRTVSTATTPLSFDADNVYRATARMRVTF